MGKDWIKLWTAQWLYGSTRDELSPAQRSIWIDLLALAGQLNKEGKNEGYIPFPKSTLARIFKVRLPLLNCALKKFEEHGKILLDNDGGIAILNWSKYNPTRLEIFRDRQKHGETPRNGVKQKDTLDRELDIYTIEDIKNSEWYSTFKADYPQFKDSDLAAALDWIAAHPSKKPKLIKRFLINWARKGDKPKETTKDLGDYD